MENLDENTLTQPSREDIIGMLNRKSYEEIYTATFSPAWFSIYTDTGIEKDKFMPALYKKWNLHWATNRDEFISKERHAELLQENWRGFQLLESLFNDTENPLRVAFEIDEFLLYPMCVATMLDIFDTEVCLDEYMEYMEDVEF